MLWHELTGLLLGEMNAGGLAGAVGERPGAWLGQTASIASRNIPSVDSGDRGNVDNVAGVVGGGTLLQQCITANGNVVDGLDVQGVDLDSQLSPRHDLKNVPCPIHSRGSRGKGLPR